MAEEYNGYYNQNVYTVMAWLDNDSNIYEQKVELFDDYYDGKISKKKLDQGINRLGRQAHMLSEIKNQKLTKEEINALRKDIYDHYKEHKEYKDSNK